MVVAAEILRAVASAYILASSAIAVTSMVRGSFSEKKRKLEVEESTRRSFRLINRPQAMLYVNYCIELRRTNVFPV